MSVPSKRKITDSVTTSNDVVTKKSKSKSKSQQPKNEKAKDFKLNKVIEKYDEHTFFIWVDGSSLQNPGPGGCAVVIEIPESILGNDHYYDVLKKYLTLPNFNSYSSYKFLNPLKTNTTTTISTTDIDHHSKSVVVQEQETKEKEESKKLSIPQSVSKSMIARYEDYLFLGDQIPSGKAEILAVNLGLDSIFKIEKYLNDNNVLFDEKYSFCFFTDSQYAIGMFDKNFNMTKNIEEITCARQKLQQLKNQCNNQVFFEKVYAHSKYSPILNQTVDNLARKGSTSKKSKIF
jgi:ribonuclease HI